MEPDDSGMLAAVAASLNTWNAGAGSPTVRCGEHGLMCAEGHPATGRLRWRCVQCGRVQAIERAHVAEAMDFSVRQGLAAGSHAAAPSRVAGRGAGGRLRVRRQIKLIGATVRLTTAEIYAVQAGAALSAVSLWFLPGVSGFAAALGLSVVATIAVGYCYPATSIRAERTVPARDLRPGDWVRMGSTGRAAGVACRVEAVADDEVRLRNGPRVCSQPGDRWTVLDVDV